MYRSMLYVPASSERFVAKAASRGADAIILDLEDGVSPEEKLPARDKLAQSVAAVATQGAAVLVRINRPLTLAVGDVQAAVRSGADGILIPKVEGPEHICLLVEVAEEEERRAKRSHPLSIIAVDRSAGSDFQGPRDRHRPPARCRHDGRRRGSCDGARGRGHRRSAALPEAPHPSRRQGGRHRFLRHARQRRRFRRCRAHPVARRRSPPPRLRRRELRPSERRADPQ